MNSDTGIPVPYRVGEWLPSDRASLIHWLETMIQKTLSEQKALHPVIADFQDLIESDPEIYMLFNQMFEQVTRHSPVSGIVRKAYVKDGTYYSEAPSEGFDPAGPNDSQGDITEVATRALIFIEADNPDIGLMCVLPVGMAEVSTCQITVYEGQHVSKGDQLGMFHFGGSTHCLIFRPGVTLEFDHHGQKPGLNSKNIPVNARIATVVRK
jgi:phosphatidylserine decarboxylase